MDDEARRAIEAILMVADTPIEPHLLAQLLEVTPARIEELCDSLAAEYEAGGRGFVLVRVSGGYRFQSHPDLAPYLERFVLDGQSARLSQAALETLAIVAYKQPVSRAQVAAIRGVNADGVLRTLLARGYLAEVARDPGPGQAVLYGTTTVFLERLGLDRIEDLPPLADFVPGPEIMDALEQTLRADPLEGEAEGALPGEDERLAGDEQLAGDDERLAADDGRLAGDDGQPAANDGGPLRGDDEEPESDAFDGADPEGDDRGTEDE